MSDHIPFVCSNINILLNCTVTAILILIKAIKKNLQERKHEICCYWCWSLLWKTGRGKVHSLPGIVSIYMIINIRHTSSYPVWKALIHYWGWKVREVYLLKKHSPMYTLFRWRDTVALSRVMVTVEIPKLHQKDLSNWAHISPFTCKSLHNIAADFIIFLCYSVSDF